MQSDAAAVVSFDRFKTRSTTGCVATYYFRLMAGYSGLFVIRNYAQSQTRGWDNQAGRSSTWSKSSSSGSDYKKFRDIFTECII